MTPSLILILALGQCPGGSCQTGQCPPQFNILHPFQHQQAAPQPQKPAGFSPCVVNVSSQMTATTRTAGLGVIVRQVGRVTHVLTCNHMTADAPSINGSQATLLWKSEQNDLRLFVVDLSPGEIIKPPARKPAAGDVVNWYNEGRATVGRVKHLASDEAVVVAGRATPGDSGGPVWFTDGSLAGILIARNTNGQEMVFVAASPFWPMLSQFWTVAQAQPQPKQEPKIELPSPVVDLSPVNGRIDKLDAALAALKTAIEKNPPPVANPDPRIDTITDGLARVVTATQTAGERIKALEGKPTPAIPDYGPKFQEIHSAIAGVATETQKSVGSVQEHVSVLEDHGSQLNRKVEKLAEGFTSAVPSLLSVALTAAGVSIPGAGLAVAGISALGWLFKRKKQQQTETRIPWGGSVAAPQPATMQPQQSPPIIVNQPSPVLPQIVTHTNEYVPYQAPCEHCNATNAAEAELIRRYPAQRGVIDLRDSFRSQIVAGAGQQKQGG